MMPQYKIHGAERRELKKELSFLRYTIKGFWHDHMMEKDMAEFYGGDVMSDEDAKILDIRNKKKVEILEKMLMEPFDVN